MIASIAPGVLVSPFDDIYTNLALEQELFARVEAPLCLLWKNRPCVVIGRYQNPFLECDAAALESDGIVLARRQSGGGTVWHDEGNLCFTFFGPRRTFDRKRNIDTVVDALKRLGFSAERNERLDILLDGRKISGSAFRETSRTSFHHGTLLVSSDLDRLRRYLKGDGRLDSAKGIKSVRSAVARLVDSCPRIDMAAVESAVADSISRSFGGAVPDPSWSVGPEPLEAILRPYAEKMRSREWIFGASPPFSRALRIGGYPLRAELRGGTVCSLDPLEEDGKKTCPESTLGELRARLLGLDYLRLVEAEDR